MPRLLWWFLAFHFVVFALGIGSYLGPSDLIFQLVKDCDDVESKVTFTMVQRRYNRTTSIFDIEIITPYVIGDGLIVELKGSVKTDGGYKPGAYYLKGTMCKVLETILGEMLDDILTAAGLDGCPLPAGHHKALNFYLDNDHFNVPQVYGEYKMEAFVYNGDSLDSCYVALYEVKSKSGY